MGQQEFCLLRTAKPQEFDVFDIKTRTSQPFNNREKNRQAATLQFCCKIFVPQRRSTVPRRDQPKLTELMTKTLLSPVGFENVLRYEPATGKFFWLVARPRKTRAGDPAGHVNKKGYIEIRYNHITYRAHRIAWYLHTGEDPHPLTIDHINGDRSDNKMCNLRLATQGQNSKNQRKRKHTKSQYKGAHWREKSGKWQSQIRVDGKSIHLGYFCDDYEAHLAYCAAAARLHGEFANFG